MLQLTKCFGDNLIHNWLPCSDIMLISYFISMVKRENKQFPLPFL